MIDPRTQYILHQERQNELMAQIERRLAAQERRSAGETGVGGNFPQPWYTAARQWFQQLLREKVLDRVLAAEWPFTVGKSH